MGTIFYLSSRHGFKVADTYTINFLFFKTLHVLVYAGLFFVLFRAYRKSFVHISQETIFLLAIITAILYGASDEIHQSFVPSREGTLRDVFIDTLGILLMVSYTKKYLAKLKWLL
jgi:VanZ family protein